MLALVFAQLGASQNGLVRFDPLRARECYVPHKIFGGSDSWNLDRFAFKPEYPGNYTFKVTVRDYCQATSQEVQVEAKCVGPPPKVELRPGQVYWRAENNRPYKDSRVTLRGSHTHDKNVEYKWALYAPVGSRTTLLVSADEKAVTFVPDMADRSYTVTVAVTEKLDSKVGRSDNGYIGCSTTYQQVTIKPRCNCAPAVNAGSPGSLIYRSDKLTGEGGLVLDGSKTVDDDEKDVVSYDWDINGWDPDAPNSNNLILSRREETVKDGNGNEQKIRRYIWSQPEVVYPPLDQPGEIVGKDDCTRAGVALPTGGTNLVCVKLQNKSLPEGRQTNEKYLEDFNSPTTSDVPTVISSSDERTNTTYYYTQRTTQTFLRTCTAEVRDYNKQRAHLTVAGEPSGYSACSGVMDVALTASDNCNRPKDIVKVSVGCNTAPVATLKCSQFSYFTGTKYEPVYVDARGTYDPDKGDTIMGTPENPPSALGNKYGTWKVTPSNRDILKALPYELGPYSRDESTVKSTNETFEPWIRKFTPGTSGDYLINLAVTDGCSVAFDQIWIYARCPFLVAEVLTPSVAYFDAFNVPEFSLNGSLSTIKPQMKAFTKISWTLISAPDQSGVSNKSIANSTGELLASFKPDRGGEYHAQLLLDDSCNKSTAVQRITYSCGLNSTHGADFTRPGVKNATINAEKEAATTSLTLTYPTNQNGFKKVEVNIADIDYTGRGKNIVFTLKLVYPSNKTVTVGQVTREAKDVKQKLLAATPVFFSFQPDKTDIGLVRVEIEMFDGCQVTTYNALSFTTTCTPITAVPEYFVNDQGAQIQVVNWLTDKFDKARVRGRAAEPTAGAAGALTYTWSILNGSESIEEQSNLNTPGEFSFRPTTPGLIRVQLSAQRKDGACAAATATIDLTSQCLVRNFVPSGTIAATSTYTAPSALFKKVPSAYWMTDAQANKEEVFEAQELDGTKIVDENMLQQSSNPPLDLSRVTYRWGGPSGVKITNIDKLKASYTPQSFRAQGISSQVYNFTLTVNDGCRDYVFYYLQTAQCQNIRSVVRASASAVTFRNQNFPIVNLTADDSSYAGEIAYYNFNRLKYEWKVISSPSGSRYSRSGRFLNQRMKPATTEVVRVEGLEDGDQYSADGSHKNNTVIMKTTITETVADVDMTSILKNHGAFKAASCFKPDLPGEYTLTLVISDECGGSSTANSVVVSATCPPLTITFNQRLPNGQPGTSYTASGKGDVRLMLDAAPTELLASNTAPNNPMMFEWKLVVKPRNSTLAVNDESYKSINNHQAAVASFRPDTNGIYVFDLTVKDGCQTITKQLTWTVQCALPAALSVSVDKQLLTYNVNQFSTSNIIGTIAGDSCNVRGWEWSLAQFTCTGFVPEPPPAAPPPADLVCKPRFQYTWSLVDKPCKSARTSSDILDRHEKVSRFTPDVPGAYRFVLKVSDDCSEAEDAIVLQAMCRNKIEVNIGANATSALSCKKGEYDPISLTARYTVQETDGIMGQEACPAPATPSTPVTPPTLEQQCCPECPTCPRCPQCPILNCPACNCPPYRVCQIIGGFDNCTGVVGGFRRSAGDETAPAETTPSLPPPVFKSPGSVSRLATGAASTFNKQVQNRLASLTEAQKTFDEYKVYNVSLIDTKNLDGKMTVGVDYSAISASKDQYELFKSEARDYLAKSSQVPTTSVQVQSVEAQAGRTVVSFHIKSTEAEIEDEPTAPLDMIDAEYYETDADSRERVLWLAAVLPIAVLLVLSVAVNVVVIQYYTRLVKSVRFSAIRMQPSSPQRA
jgi:hypothetical protein